MYILELLGFKSKKETELSKARKRLADHLFEMKRTKTESIRASMFLINAKFKLSELNKNYDFLKRVPIAVSMSGFKATRIELADTMRKVDSLERTKAELEAKTKKQERERQILVEEIEALERGVGSNKIVFLQDRKKRK